MPISPIRSITTKVWGLSFDGVDDRGIISKAGFLGGWAEGLTFEALAMPRRVTSIPQNIVWAGGDLVIVNFHYTQRVGFYFRTDAGTYGYYYSNLQYLPNEWYYIMIRYDPARGTLELFINNELDTVITGVTGTPYVADWLQIATDYAASSNWLDGVIAFLRFYSRPLTDDEILDNYHGYVTTDGLVLWLWANELLASGNVWRDRSGNENHATINGAVWTETPRIEFAKPTRLIAQTRLISPTR